jgi:hypothetical protein
MDKNKKNYHNFNFSKSKNKLSRKILKKIKQLKFYEALTDTVNENIYLENIEKLLKWCNYKKIFVIFSKNSPENYSNTLKKIQINSNSSFESQFFTLLHECGHHLIFETSQRDPQIYLEKFSKGYYIPLSKKNLSTFSRKVSIICEEIEAWSRGFSLAKRLDLSINLERYENYKNKCLKTYINWGSEKEK